jgi:hypothetical protein
VISRIATIGAIALFGSLSVTVPAAAADESKGIQLEVRVDNQKVDGKQLRLDPASPVRIDLRVQNRGRAEAQIRTVRLSGTALGLTFFAYDTSVALSVPAGETATQGFSLDLSDLDSQVTGLLPAKVAILDQDRTVLADSEATADVRGSLVSVYGLFGIAVLLMTVFSWGAALFALARHRLPANRWRRALRFLPAGVGTGLTAVITLSVLRFVAPSPLAEIPLVLVAGAVGFVLGYLTPTPDGGATDVEATQETPTLVQPQGGLA